MKEKMENFLWYDPTLTLVLEQNENEKEQHGF
jgi:hypothetical protein